MQDAQWAEDYGQDDDIEGLMRDPDSPQSRSRRRRSSSPHPMSSHHQQHLRSTTSSSSHKKRRPGDLSDGERSRSKPAPPPSKKSKVGSTSSPNLTAKGKGKEVARHEHDEQQRREDREQQKRKEDEQRKREEDEQRKREEDEQRKREEDEQRKREERRKEHEQHQRELKMELRRLEEEEESQQDVRQQQQQRPDKKQAAIQKEKERTQERPREQAKHGKANGTDKGKATAPKKRSKADEDIAWADEMADGEAGHEEPSGSTHIPKCRRVNQPNDDGSELSEVDEDGDFDPSERRIAVIIRKEGRIRLTKQYGRVQRVCVAAIKELLTNICIKNAFPDGPDMASDFARTALITAAKMLKYTDITQKLRNDKQYWRKLSLIPSQRVCNLHGKVKKGADPLVATVFDLEDGDVDKVHWLHDGLRYIYLHNYEKDTVDGDKAYSPPIFYQILRNVFFNKHRSFGFIIAERFESSHPEKPDEKEIPAPLLALVATGIHASIEDHRTSRSEVGDFKGNIFLDAYRSHIDVLSEIKSDNINAYHRLMHDLYCKLTGMSASSVRKNARSFLNAKDMVQ